MLQVGNFQQEDRVMMVLWFFVVQRITLLKPHPTDVRQTGHEQYPHGVRGGMGCPPGQYNKTYI